MALGQYSAVAPSLNRAEFEQYDGPLRTLITGAGGKLGARIGHAAKRSAVETATSRRGCRRLYSEAPPSVCFVAIALRIGGIIARRGTRPLMPSIPV